MKKILFTLCCLWSLQASAQLLQTGVWRATLMSPGGTLPFGLDIRANSMGGFTAHILNGSERLLLDEARLDGDSLRLALYIFEAEIVAKISNNTLTGYWRRKRTATTYNKLPFAAEWGKTYRFVPDAPTAPHQVTGKWATTFYTERDSSVAVGIFEQKGNRVNGTFLTPTGDYRYLDGNVVGDTLYLSTFDGTHVFLFKSRIEGKQLTGGFYSGVAGFERMKATFDPAAALPDANSLTFLKPGYERITFSFPNTKAQQVSLADARYQGKVTVLQIMGTWCPNCMDETNFLSAWYKKNHKRGVEIIGLAYEKSADLKEASPRIERLKQRFDVPYEILLAGTNNKDDASKTLPMLNRILAFPTTIFVDKKGKVRQIHTGFSGPGTGKYYDQFVDEFNRLINKLLAE